MIALDSLLNLFFAHQLKIKMFHFQTKLYGAHKASDDYLSKYEDNLDKFFEVAQGVFGKLECKKMKIEFDTLDEFSVNDEIDKFVKILKVLDNQYNKFPELINIRDEIVADANQFKYLLTFK